MLKFLIAFLVIANGLLYAYNTGHLGTGAMEGHEPARMKQQLNAERIRLVSPSVSAAPSALDPSSPAAARPTPGTATVSPATDMPVVSADSKAPAFATSGAGVSRQCIEIGNFDAADARRFDKQLATLGLGDQVTRHSVQGVDRYLVYIPPLPDKESADRKGAQLRKQGIEDFFVLTEGADLRHGISLGIFKNEDAARSHLSTLLQKGVDDAKISARPGPATRTVFQLHVVKGDAQKTLERIRIGFPRQGIRQCALS